MDLDKRDLRHLKREIKRKGNQHRRRQLKRALAEHPDEAADDVPSVGRYRSELLNGLDRKSIQEATDIARDILKYDKRLS